MKNLFNCKLFFGVFFIALCFSCSTQKVDIKSSAKTLKPASSQPKFAHNVYFWLKKGTTKIEEQAFMEGLTKLGTVPSIHSYYWGKPAATEKRGVVDNSYHYAINSFFSSIEEHDLYQVDPIHLAFIEDHKHIWEKVVVYDNEME